MPTLKVLDFNAVAQRSQLAESFFRESPENIGVVTDMLGAESLKRGSLDNYRQSFRVLSAYSDRVVVLKQFADLRRLRPRSAGFPTTLVDQARTRLFPALCDTILNSQNAHTHQEISQMIDGAKAFMARIENLGDSQFRPNITEYIKSTDPEKLKRWRAGQAVSDEEFQQLKAMTAGVTTGLFNREYPNEPVPDRVDALCWIPFRHVLAVQALTLKWIRDGGHLNANAEKLRNDNIDVFYVTYGTVFDGIVTDDRRLLDVYDIARRGLTYF